MDWDLLVHTVVKDRSIRYELSDLLVRVIAVLNGSDRRNHVRWTGILDLTVHEQPVGYRIPLEVGVVGEDDPVVCFGFRDYRRIRSSAERTVFI